MKVTDEMLEAFAKVYYHRGVIYPPDSRIEVGLQAALDVMPKQELVAFIDMSLYPPIRFPDGQLRCDIEHLDGLALYTSPQPQQEPLSKEKVLSLALKHTSKNHEGFTIFDCYGFANEIEKAHGIGV